MLTELLGKGGCLCQPAREGKLRCPLIVRPTSEDVITGHLFQALQILDSRRWLPEFLNVALEVKSFRTQIYRRLKIELWKNRSKYPRELVPWSEGSTQVDVTMTWENPPTSVFIEMKYGSDLSPSTSTDYGQHGYPSDQLVRNARVGLLECGYFRQNQLFELRPRDFMLLVISPEKHHPLIQKYRDPTKLRAAIPHSDQIPRLPKLPFIGQLSYGDIVQILRQQRRWFSRPEKVLVDLLTEYLEWKRAKTPGRFVLNTTRPQSGQALNSQTAEG